MISICTLAGASAPRQLPTPWRSIAALASAWWKWAESLALQWSLQPGFTHVWMWGHPRPFTHRPTLGSVREVHILPELAGAGRSRPERSLALG